MVALRGSTKNPPYQLDPKWDVDLQDSPPATGFAAKGKDGRARDEALRILRAHANLPSNVTLANFEVTKTAAGDTGPHTPVEWRYTMTIGHGDRASTWTYMVDMDSIPSGVTGAGPDRPHIGFSFWSTGYDAQSRVNGHIFIEYVPASR